MNFRPAGYSDDEEEEDEEFMYGSWSNDNFESTNYNRIDSIKIPETDENLLLTAVNGGDLETVRSIIAKGFKVDDPLSGGWSALMYACSLGSYTLVQFLIEAKANVNFNKELYTPLMALCKSTSTNEDELNQCLNALVQNGADINATDRNASTALMNACSSGHVQLVETLVNLNCDVNIQDIEGWSALFHAVVNGGREDIIKTLLEGKARVDLIDRRRRSAYDLAMVKGFGHVGHLVCSKKEKRKLLQEDDINVPDTVISSNAVEELLSQLPSTNGKNISGFASDVNKLLWAMGVGYFSKQFTKNSIQLNELLLITDEKLKNLGVRFSVHRQTILNSLRNFHVHQWNKASLGMKPRNQQMSVEDGVRLMYNIVKHLHVLNATINYLKIHQPLPMRSDVFKLSENAVHQLTLINSELSAVCSFASKLKHREKMEPVDLIKPRKHSNYYIVPILTSTILVSFVLFFKKYN